MAAFTTFASFNKEIILLDELKVPINDRAFFFGDGVYEVLRVYQGQPFLFDEHMERLKRSLSAVNIHGVPDLTKDILANIALNDVGEGMVYMQISRGSAPRVHSFHNASLTPNILIYSKPFHEHPSDHEAKTGITAITHDDIRWGRCDIKSINLLPNCLAQSLAHEKGAHEAIFIRNDKVTEGSSCNVFLVKNNVIKTPPLSPQILPGTRRQFLTHSLRADGFHVLEETATKSELYDADEVFITSSIKEALAVIAIDQKPINGGQIGDISKRARELILDAAKSRLN